MYSFRKEVFRASGRVTNLVTNRRKIVGAHLSFYKMWRQRRLSYEQQSL